MAYQSIHIELQDNLSLDEWIDGVVMYNDIPWERWNGEADAGSQLIRGAMLMDAVTIGYGDLVAEEHRESLCHWWKCHWIDWKVYGKAVLGGPMYGIRVQVDRTPT